MYEIGGQSGREYITVLGCGSADGIQLPPFVLYKAKNLWERCTRVGLLMLNMVCQTVIGSRKFAVFA